MDNKNQTLTRFSLGNESIKSTIFWKKIFIYFWVFSIVGHFIEIIWAQVNHIIFGYPIWKPIIYTFTPVAAPYGFGAIAVILFVWPLLKRHNLNLLGVFFLSVLVTTITEYLCALVVVLFVGHNYFWSYSDQFLNINGYVCLEASLLFGISATIFLYYIYPFCEKIISRFSPKQFNRTFWFLFISYGADLVYAWTK